MFRFLLFPVVAFVVMFLVAAPTVSGQNVDPAYAPLDEAYQALRAKDYDRAIAAFHRAMNFAPDRASIHKDLAYALLKIGESEEARDQFQEALRLDPADDHVALEYAFLCYETRQPATARRIFDRLGKAGNATAAQAFENVDRPLREGITRWKLALELSPDNLSVHEELAKLAEQRDELDLAAEHYQKAWRLRPDRRSLLLDLGRVLQALGRNEEAFAALLAASRGQEPRVAEEARELLPTRYPYVYEFERALALDPTNDQLRRELAYLRLQMGNDAAAEQQFESVVASDPSDLLSVAQLGFLKLSRGDSAAALPFLNKVLAGKDEELADRVRRTLNLPQSLKGREEEPRAAITVEAKDLAAKSLEKGYLQDALKYLRIAHENDPVDFGVMLKLGWAYNILKDDREASRWFNLARRSPDNTTAAEASLAYRNLEPELRRFRTTVWMFPTFSTRWHDLFAYAQAKTELKLPRWWIQPYLSTRFVGDIHDAVKPPGFAPQYLSERSLILGAGLATPSWHGLTGWFEAGASVRYAAKLDTRQRVISDYRGGLNFARGLGQLLAPGAHGIFAETGNDGIFVSRFGNDMLLYSQNRMGYTFRGAESAGGVHAQLYWNWNATVDRLGQYWANYVETGPGLRFRLEKLPASVMFSIDAVRGLYFENRGNPHGPIYNDLRIGVWYAFTR